MISKANLMAVSALMGILLAVAPSYADSGIQRHVGGSNTDVEVVGQIFVNQRANHRMVVEIREAGTGDPRPRPHAVLDVFDASTSGFLGHGEYAYAGEVHNARVIVGATNRLRTIVVIVRGVAGSALQGGISVSATEADNWNWQLLGECDVAPGPRVPTGSLMANTFIRTVEEPGGTGDTILMVLRDEIPLAMDDNSGVDRMSFIALSSACEGNCSILPARRSNWLAAGLGVRPPPVAGPVTVVWDEGAYRNRADRDRDGLGDALEVALGTCTDPNTPANDKDTDGDGTKDCMDKDVDEDGIPDGYEVLGKADEAGKENQVANLTKFPYYGADPLQQDLFAEVDWFWNCKDSEATCAPGHPTDPRLKDKDAFQFTAQTARDYVRRFRADLRVHLDIGNGFVTTGVPASDAHGNYGNWRGAEVLPDSTSEHYDTGGFKGGFSAARRGLFVHLVSDASKGGGVGWAGKWARCNSGARNCVHETGHVLGLNHWGEWSGDTTGKANCKPNYISVMNYATNESGLIGGGGPNDLPAFSHGRYAGSSLNPNAINEAAGLSMGGTPDTNSRVLDVLKQVYGFQVDAASGGIDWDQDGVIQPAGAPNVKAFINRYQGGSGEDTEGCDPDQTGLDSVRFNYVSTMVPTPTGLTIYLTGLSFISELWSKCTSIDDTACAGFWYDRHSGVTANMLARAKSTTAAGGIIVFEDDRHRLQYVGRSPSGKAVGGLLGGPSIAGPPTAIIGPNTGIGINGRIRVYAPVTTGSGGAAKTTLRLWEYDPTQDVWFTLGIEQHLVGSTAPIEMMPGTGVGLAVGSRSDIVGAQLFAAIPSRNSTNGDHELLFAMLRETSQTVVVPAPPPIGTFTVTLPEDEWDVLPSDIWGRRGGVPAADVGRVGLAFLPADPAVWNDPNGGRFYVSWQTFNHDTPPRAVALISSTRGNVWPLMSGTPDQTAYGLYFTGDSVFSPYNGKDDNWPQGMVLAAKHGRVVGLGGPGYRYFPNADGARDLQQSDHNDLDHIRRKLSCAIRGCGSLLD